MCERIKDNGSDIVGFSVSFTHQIYETIRLANYLRDFLPDKHFTIGGQGVSFIMESVLKENKVFDSGVFGEGEVTLLQLVNCIENKVSLFDIKGAFIRKDNNVVFNGYRNPIEDLDHLPFLNKNTNLKDTKLKHLTMISSRGCIGKCTFCTSGYLQNKYHDSKKWRFRSANNIIDEIEYVNKSFDKIAVSFIDDNFLGGTSEGYLRAYDFANLIINKNINIKWSMECRAIDVKYDLFKLLKKSGLCNVFIGVESGNMQDLKLFNKQVSVDEIKNAFNILNRLNISYSIGFIMYHPTSTVSQLKENAYFLKDNKLAFSSALTNSLTLYQGLPLISYYDRKGLLFYDKYSITYKFESDSVKKIYELSKMVFSKFSNIENVINEIIFNSQNKYKDYSEWNDYNRFKNYMKLLSDFEANIFLNICDSTENNATEIPNYDSIINIYLNELNTNIKSIKV